MPKEQPTPTDVAREYAYECLNDALNECVLLLDAKARQAIKSEFVKCWEASEHRLEIDLADAADQEEGAA
jgi:hypothetical protein